MKAAKILKPNPLRFEPKTAAAFFNRGNYKYRKIYLRYFEEENSILPIVNSSITTNDVKSVLADFDKAIELNPNFVDAYVERIDCNRSQWINDDLGVIANRIEDEIYKVEKSISIHYLTIIYVTP